MPFATKASNDSCAYTNACMQHKNFNQDEWRAVELLVSEFKLATKLTVMTGPVFTTTDRFYIKAFGDYPVRISTKKHKALLTKDPKTLQLDAGIVGESSIDSARDNFPLEAFYAMIEEISWV
jgi:DNA/RNA endonuclease G (NUC1)